MPTASKATSIDLRQIKYFAAPYEEHNVTKAAHRLNVVPPALSMQISRLEKNFKTQLAGAEGGFDIVSLSARVRMSRSDAAPLLETINKSRQAQCSTRFSNIVCAAQLLISPPMHAFGLLREILQHVWGPSQSHSNFLRPPNTTMVYGFPLARIGQVITAPARE
jgi:hypothetical protein